MTVGRRRFLVTGAAAGAAVLAMPGWLARAFAQDRAARESTTSLATFSAAYRDAQRLGKPLVVLVVPADDAAQWRRARAFGELLNGGSDGLLADLALAHVVCAQMSAVRSLVPQAPPGEPTMLLVDASQVPARVTALNVTLAESPPEGDVDTSIDARIAALTTALHGALAPDAATLSARAGIARAHADAATLRRIDAALHGGPALDGPTADRAAAVVALAAQSAPAALATTLRESLTKGAAARLRVARVPGSVWANDASCGIEIEGSNEPNMMDCGMGSVSPRSARFLYFYTRPY